MQKNVQIPYDLFMALVRFHLFELEEDEMMIQSGLERKLNAMAEHEYYKKYKTAPSEEEREEARRNYLDSRGIPTDFRW